MELNKKEQKETIVEEKKEVFDKTKALQVKVLQAIKEQRKKYETKVVLAQSEVNAILTAIENALK